MPTRCLPKIFPLPAIIQAPMAGGITTPQLVAAISNNDGLGSYATGYVKTTDIRTQIQSIKALTNKPFAINAFIPSVIEYDQASLRIYQDKLNLFRQKLGLKEETTIPSSLQLEDNLSEIVEIVVKEKISIFSFTFGRLPSKHLEFLKESNVFVIGTATTPEEAQILENDGVDAIVAQGIEAGGHRGSFLPGAAETVYSTLDLVVACISKTNTTPVIAAGGIMTGNDIYKAFSHGAAGVQMGTAFLTVKESGANPVYQSQLRLKMTEEDPTVLTKAYSGKLARGLKTIFIDEVEKLKDIPCYPAPHIMSAPIRKAAAERQNPELMSHWSGQGLKYITLGLSAKELIEKLLIEYNNPDSNSNLQMANQTSKSVNNIKSCLNKDSKKAFMISVLSIVNGIFYYAIAVEGGANMQNTFNISMPAIQVISVGAALVYTMFMYKTLESATLIPKSPAQIIFTTLAPFSAIAFLTAGTSGAKLLGLSQSIAYTFGITLFVLRMINCIDASVKFPNRLIETKLAWIQAYRENDRAEMARLIVVWLSSIAYVLCTTDAIYNAVQIISSLAHISESVSNIIGISAAILGALGTLPLNVYWSHRGLRQLTNGGKLSPDGTMPDPTDRYTYLGLICVIPILLGILGGATAASGKMFGQCGDSSKIIRLISSLLYAMFAGTPGMATLLRTLSKKIQILKHKHQHEEQAPLLGNHRNSFHFESPKDAAPDIDQNTAYSSMPRR